METSRRFGPEPSQIIGRCRRHRRTRRAGFALFLALVSLLPGFAQIETKLSGTAALEAQLATSPPENVSTALFMRLQPHIALRLPRPAAPEIALLALQAGGDLRLNLRWATITAEAYSAVLHVTPWEALRLSVGVAPAGGRSVHDLPGLTLPRLIVPAEPAALLRGDEKVTPETPSARLRFVAADGGLHRLPAWLPVDVDIVLYPWAPRPRVPALSSPWFSYRGIPDTQEWAFYDRSRAEILIEEEAFGRTGPPETAAERAGYTAALGVDYPFADLRVGAFAGWNPDLLLSGEMMVRLEDSRTFRVVLTPEQRRVDGWFADAALRIPGRGHPELFSLRARLSRTPRKPFITRSLRPDTNTTRLERMDATAAGVVAALRLYTPEGALRTRLWGGARHGWVAPVFRDRVTRPYLASRLSAGVELQLWRRLDMGAELLLSMSDGSLRVTPSAALRIAEGISVAAEAPLFFGGAETELGEYGENGFIRLILGISF